MASKAFVPQIWAATIMRTLEKNLIARQICNMDYTGEIKKHGDTVHFPGLMDPAVNTYAGTITYETLLSSDIPLLIDQQNYFAFKVTDIEKAQSKVDMQSSQANRAAYQLKNACDAHILGLYGQAGLTEVEDTSLDSATVISSVGLMAQRLEEVNVKRDNMVIVIPPWVALKLRLAGITFGIKEGASVKNGLEWTKELGFDLYVSNNLTNTAGTPVTKCLGLSRNAIAFAEQIVETRAMDLEDSFSVGVSGLHVFGAKVVKPKEMVVGTFTYAAETTI
jgi:hypothetical protein